MGKLSPYGNGPTTSAEDDFEALERLKPKTYKAMEDPHFMKSKYKSLYAPIKCTVSFQVMILNVALGERITLQFPNVLTFYHVNVPY